MRKTLLGCCWPPASVTPALAQEKTVELKRRWVTGVASAAKRRLGRLRALRSKKHRGTIKIQVYPAQQSARRSTITDMASAASRRYLRSYGYQPGRFPISVPANAITESDARRLDASTLYRKYARRR